MRKSILVFQLTILVFLTHSNLYAAPKTKIKGQLSQAGYQILASDPSGDSAVSKSQNFTISSSIKKGSLALVNSSGNASGPVVLAIKDKKGKIFTYAQATSSGMCADSGTKAITGFKIPSSPNKKGKSSSSLNLGTVTVDTANGFAYSSKKFSNSILLKGSSASVNTNCVPSGAGGKLGLAGTNTLGIGLSKVALAAGDDADNDGVKSSADPDDDNDGASDKFDLDSNGDGILDFYQRDPIGNFVGDNDDDNDNNDDNDKDDKNDEEDIDDNEYFAFIFSNFQVNLHETVNLSVGNFTQDQINALFQSRLNLALGVPGDGSLPIELDCNGLSYCSLGGTGTIANYGGPSVGQSFPDNFDTDGDGMGRIDQVAAENPIKDFFLKPNAVPDQVRAGNVVTQLITDGKKNVLRPLMLEFVFNTVPAIKSLRLGENNQTVTTISYPVAVGEPGTGGNCFQHSIANGHKVELTVHRPQRPGIVAAGESAFMNMGNLRIVASVTHDNGGVLFCPATAFSTTDPNLVPFTGYPGDTDPNQELGLLDNLGDAPFVTGTESTFTFTLDLQQCTGQLTGVTDIDLKLRTPRNDNAAQRFCIQRG